MDMLLFYPGGAIMDRFGRVYVAAPSMIVLGLGFVLLPLTSGPTSVGLVAALMGLGNGISAGIASRRRRLTTAGSCTVSGGWRVCSDLGNAAGPLVISVVSALASWQWRLSPWGCSPGRLGLVDLCGAEIRPRRSPTRRTRGTGTLEMATNDLLVWVDCEMT